MKNKKSSPRFIKNLLLAISAVSLTSLCLSLQAKEVEDFNYQWKFSLEKQQAAHQEKFDDSTWTDVRLPHDWSVALPYTNEGAASTGLKLGGIGWYRKDFTLTEADIDKQIWLEFDGIYNNSAIWINGHYVGGRPYGYSSFQVDLTQYVYTDGRANNVAVKVDRTAFADSRWYTGSGIYRNVRLVKTEPVYIPQWGIQVSTPEVSTEEALINIKTEVKDKKPKAQIKREEKKLLMPVAKKLSKIKQRLIYSTKIS